MFSEGSQTQKVGYGLIPFILNIHSKETESRFMVIRVMGEREYLLRGARVSFWGDTNILKLESGDACTILFIY